MTSTIANSGAVKKSDGRWYIGDVQLVCPAHSDLEAPEIIGDLQVFDRIVERYRLPMFRIYLSNVTPLVYLSWLDLHTIADEYKDPHIRQYDGTWGLATREQLLHELAAMWRPDPGRRPSALGAGPGWDAWAKGRPRPWSQADLWAPMPAIATTGASTDRRPTGQSEGRADG